MSSRIGEYSGTLTQWLRSVVVRMPIALAIIGVGAWYLASPSARAVNDKMQLVTGGVLLGYGQGNTGFTGPGLSDVASINFPSPGQGERAVQTRMTGGGRLSSLWVRMHTVNAPSSGSFTLMVRINESDTTLTCQLVATGQCTSGGAAVNLNNGDRLAIRVSNDFPDSGNVVFMYSMLLD